jgi:hypothetical protein
MEWCGWLVGTKTLSFQKDNYRNRFNRTLAQSATLELCPDLTKFAKEWEIVPKRHSRTTQAMRL